MGTRKLLTIALGAALLAGCAANSDDRRNTKSYSGPATIESSERTPSLIAKGPSSAPIRTIRNTAYVSLDDLTKVTGYRGKWLRNGSFGVGDNDPRWYFRTGESDVVQADQTIKLPAPTIREGNKLFIPAAGVKDVFGGETDFKVESDKVSFFPRPMREETGVTGSGLDFKDEPAGFLNSDKVGKGRLRTLANSDSTDDHGMDDSERDKMIEFAEKYMGVKYDFGAEPYKESGKFDCSTFVQHVYGHFGLDMPRLARQQAKKGENIDRDGLQKGDLLFFYVPGRFKSNRTVGHVGIYYGDGKMIHASPLPDDGVQITSINKPYWKDTFLYAKRNF